MRYTDDPAADWDAYSADQERRMQKLPAASCAMSASRMTAAGISAMAQSSTTERTWTSFVWTETALHKRLPGQVSDMPREMRTLSSI